MIKYQYNPVEGGRALERKRLVIGIVAHVDAGKTTLSEALLYKCGALREIGRVDKGTAYLDNHYLEKERGITIFSKQASIRTESADITLIDTPGHIDFSCETERTLCIQDYALLVVNGAESTDAHTRALWNLLLSRKIPTFIFINKTDIASRSRSEIFNEIKREFKCDAVDFSIPEHERLTEEIAASDPTLMKEFFDTGDISDQSIASAIKDGRIFPCCFGSALKMKGIERLIEIIDKYTLPQGYQERIFGARVYKISRDESNHKLSFVKITGGILHPKDVLVHTDSCGEIIEEKVEEIRVYSSKKYTALKSAPPGTVCALVGPEKTKIGEGLGMESDDDATLTPVLDYRMLLPKDTDAYALYLKLLTLKDEDPTLGISFDEKSKEIKIHLMGEIQTEIQKRIIRERFGVDVEFDGGSILYKETVAEPIMGSGHFEPLRHYAEVHLMIEPLPEGSGIIADTDCDADSLPLNWQHLVLSHIEEKVHRGVLTGAPLTDVRITLKAGRGHIKHTVGGDFRQATYRAIRQGLMKSRPVLLEPTFDFTVTLPTENLGRAMTDIDNMHGTVSLSEISGSEAKITGNCPVATIRNYATVLRAYTKGAGTVELRIGKYMPCHNSEEIIAKCGYDPLLDEKNTASSVFCKNGSGYAVPWNEADSLMHISLYKKAEESATDNSGEAVKAKKKSSLSGDDEKELMNIFEATYGKIKPRKIYEKTENSAAEYTNVKKPKRIKSRGEELVLIDGYNLIFAWEELRKCAENDFAHARDVLIRMMCSYSAFKKCRTVIVFDAYKRKDSCGSTEVIGNVNVVYTKESETADSYIEKTAHELADKYFLRVVTSDMQEQYIVLGVGGFRVTPAEFRKETEAVTIEINEAIKLYSK